MLSLQYWLLVVAALRVFSVYTGYFNRSLFQKQVFNRKPTEVNGLAGRLFAVWTLLTATCCTVCTLYIQQQGIYLLTYLSFIIALLYFTLELLVYQTISVRTMLPMLAVTSISIVWMPQYWYNAHGYSMFRL